MISLILCSRFLTFSTKISSLCFWSVCSSNSSKIAFLISPDKNAEISSASSRLSSAPIKPIFPSETISPRKTSPSCSSFAISSTSFIYNSVNLDFACASPAFADSKRRSLSPSSSGRITFNVSR